MNQTGRAAIPDFDGRPFRAEIDLDALEHNLRQLRGLIGRHSQVCAVVKANAYGHGAVPVALALQAAGTERFGVATIDEGVQLRSHGIERPVLVMSPVTARELPRAVEHGLIVTVDHPAIVERLARLAGERGVTANVHLKIDSGMHRCGVAPEDAAALAGQVAAQDGLRLEGLWTHFANADEADKSFVWQQYRLFERTIAGLPDVPLRHVANSATLLDLPELALDMVRPGIAVLGMYPSAEVQHDAGLQPALALRARLTRVHRVDAGDSVSYGRTWRAERAGQVGLVPLGYADGYRRGLSNRASMLLDGRRVRVAGRVTMDQTMLDLGDANVEAGAAVTIYGRDGDETVSVDEIARLEGTINYEITCAIAARVPRLAVRQGRIEAIHTLLGDVSPQGVYRS